MKERANYAYKNNMPKHVKSHYKNHVLGEIIIKQGFSLDFTTGRHITQHSNLWIWKVNFYPSQLWKMDGVIMHTKIT